MDEDSAKPSDPELSTEAVHGGSYFWVLWALFFILVFYPLSIGPAARIHEKQPATRPVIEIIYKPLTTLIDHSQPTCAFFVWYLEKVWKLPLSGSPRTNAPARTARTAK